MRTSRFTDSQILAILKQNESGVAFPELCREHGMSTAQSYKWRAISGQGPCADEIESMALYFVNSLSAVGELK